MWFITYPIRNREWVQPKRLQVCCNIYLGFLSSVVSPHRAQRAQNKVSWSFVENGCKFSTRRIVGWAKIRPEASRRRAKIFMGKIKRRSQNIQGRIGQWSPNILRSGTQMHAASPWPFRSAWESLIGLRTTINPRQVKNLIEIRKRG